jgi:hypothetical protein
MVHLGVLAFMLLGAPGTLASGGGASGDAADDTPVTVSLESLQGAAQRSPNADPDAERLKLLFHQMLDRPDAVIISQDPPKPKSSLQALYDAIIRQGGSTGSAVGKGRSDSGAARDRELTDRRARLAALDPDADAAGPERGKGPVASGGGGLWGQIKPCWDKLPARSSVPVTLIVTINEQGLIAQPPTIVRPSGAAPDHERQISEARALAALSACVPYVRADIAGLQREFRVELGPSPAPATRARSS